MQRQKLARFPTNPKRSSKYGGGGQFAYLLDSDGQNLKLYLGIGNSTENVATETVANATFLRDTFAGIYAGSQCEVCGQNLFNLCSKIFKLCTESLHSDKTHRQRQKTLCFDYRGRKPMNQEQLINLYLKMKIKINEHLNNGQMRLKRLKRNLNNCL